METNTLMTHMWQFYEYLHPSINSVTFYLEHTTRYNSAINEFAYARAAKGKRTKALQNTPSEENNQLQGDGGGSASLRHPAADYFPALAQHAGFYPSVNK